MEKFEVGALLRTKREMRGLTQDQVVQGAGLPDATYLSRLETAAINPIRSKYFVTLVNFLGFTEEEVRGLRGHAVFSIETGSDRASTQLTPITPSPELDQMLTTYAPIDPELKDPAWRQFLAGLPTAAGATARDWYDVFSSLKRIGLQPEKAC